MLTVIYDFCDELFSQFELKNYFLFQERARERGSLFQNHTIKLI